MNALLKSCIAMGVSGLMAVSALAQPGPGGPGGGGPGGPGGGPPGGGPHRMDQNDHRPPPPDRGGMGMDFDGPRDRERERERDRDAGGGMHEPPEMGFVRLFRGYLDLVQQMTELAKDPSASGVSAVLTASDILKARSNNDAIAFFADILPQVKDETIKRAIQLQLVDLYKKSNQHDKALEQLKTLIVPPSGQ